MQEDLTIYMHNIHTNGITKKEYTNMSQQLEIYTLLFHEQVEYGRGYKLEKKLTC